MSHITSPPFGRVSSCRASRQINAHDTERFTTALEQLIVLDSAPPPTSASAVIAERRPCFDKRLKVHVRIGAQSDRARHLGAKTSRYINQSLKRSLVNAIMLTVKKRFRPQTPVIRVSLKDCLNAALKHFSDVTILINSHCQKMSC